MIVSVHQPQYLPWLGYFNKILNSDAFVFLDNVQYKAREYQNRNRIRTKDGWMWLTVPILKNGEAYPKISDVIIDNSQEWRKRHWRAVCVNYSRAPFFERYSGFFENLYSRNWERLIELNIYIIESMNRFLGIEKPVYFESRLKVKTRKTERIHDICKVLGADTYLSGIGGRVYLDEGLFEAGGIKLEYQDFRHPEYDQLHEPFIPFMSIVDLLFNKGAESLKILISKKESSGKLIKKEF